MEVNGRTRIIGIFGYPIEHTLSPLMHNAAFDRLNLNMCYAAFSVPGQALADAVAAIRSLNLAGANITVPHKEKVIPLLDKVDEEAEFIGAVNTVTNNGGFLTGYNTDGRGLMRSFEEEAINVQGTSICIIGAGGASRAIGYYLSQKASRLSLFDIDKQKAGKLAADLNSIRGNVSLVDDISMPGSPDIIINATPLGLKPDDALPLNPESIHSDMVVCDLIYRKTRLLREAEKRQAKIIDGSGMLLWQGVLAFELWTGIHPPVDLMRDILLSNIR